MKRKNALLIKGEEVRIGPETLREQKIASQRTKNTAKINLKTEKDQVNQNLEEE